MKFPNIIFSDPKGVRPAIYSENLNGQTDLGLYIPVLTETMAGTYYCTAVYGNTKEVSAKVSIETIS